MLGTTIAVAIFLAQAAQVAQPEDQISDHVSWNIKKQVSNAKAGAMVTVLSFDGKTAELRVDVPVFGTLPETIKVSAKPMFMKQDLEVGNQLLVFFNGKDNALKPTGQYEMVIDGKIREYSTDIYLGWAKYEFSKVPAKKPGAKPAPAAPTGPVSAASPAQTKQG